MTLAPETRNAIFVLQVVRQLVEGKQMCHRGHCGNASHCICCLYFPVSLSLVISHSALGVHITTLPEHKFCYKLCFLGNSVIYQLLVCLPSQSLKFYQWHIIFHLNLLFPCNFQLMAHSVTSGKVLNPMTQLLFLVLDDKKASGNNIDCILISIVEEVQEQILRDGPASPSTLGIGLLGSRDALLSPCPPGCPGLAPPLS